MPACLPVPPDCPVDGKHIFIPYPTARIINTQVNYQSSGQCLELFTQGPCSKGLVLRRVEDQDTSVKCDFAASEPDIQLPVLIQPTEPCHRSSRRGQNNQCLIKQQ